MSEQLQLVIVRNPFDRRVRDERNLAFTPDTTLQDIVTHHLPMSNAITVAVDGVVIPANEWETCTLSQGQQLVVMPVVHDGDTLGQVLMIALVVFAPGIGAGIYAGVTGGAAMGAAMGGLMTMGVMAIGSSVIGGLFPPQKPNLPGRQSYDTSPSYSWSPATTQQPGGVISRAYGLHKLYGNIIAGYIENTGSTGQDQIAHMLIDLGMGPYQRLYDFKINDQPVGYYSGVTITERRGHLNQTPIPAFNDTRLTRPVNAKVVDGTPIVRDTVGNDFDALEIVLVCPSGLWYSNDAGGLDTVNVNISVEISADGGTTWRHVAVEPRDVTSPGVPHWSLGSWQGNEWATSWVEEVAGSTDRTAHYEGELQGNEFIGYKSWRWIDTPDNIVTTVYDSITLSGNTQKPIRRTLRVDNLTRGLTYKVRATNLTPDQTSSRYGDDTYLSEINEVMYDDYQYPRTVLVGVDALATNQLSGSLKFGCMAEAAIVRVWNGSAWASQFSRNPAWVCWDVLTQPVLDDSLNPIRYDGLDPSRLNLASFYAWAQFCDALVPNGAGGTEARCYFDGVFDTPTTLWDAALEVCASARAQLVMRGTTISVVVDDVRATPAQLFNVGNTNVNSFSEIFLPITDRAASIEVNFANADQDYQRDTLTVVNTAITEASAQRTQVGLRGITRASQAWREAFFRLKRNELLKRSASISVDIDALACTVGDLIWLQNDVTQWGVGGRADVGSTTTQLKLDIPVTLAPATTYELKLRLADDTLVTRTITTAAGTVSAVDVSVAFPSAPSQYDVWAIGEVNKAVKEFIVLDVKRDADQRAKLSLVEYNASLYGTDSGIPTIPTANISATVGVPTITDISVEEVMERAQDGTILVHLDIHFSLADAVKVVFYQGGTVIGEDATGIFRVENVTSGASYAFVCAPVNALGVSPSSRRKRVTHTVVGKLAPPSDVTSLTATIVADGIDLSWADIPDLDRMDYAICQGAAWGGDYKFYSGSTARIPPALVGTYTYRIKARDTTKHFSVNDTSCTFSITAPQAPVFTGEFLFDSAKLSWTKPAASQTVDRYELRVGASWATATLVGTLAVTSLAVKADWIGLRTYWIAAVDIAGNVGTPKSLEMVISAPPAPTITAQVIDNNVLLYWNNVAGTLPTVNYELRKGSTWATAEPIGMKSGSFTSVFETVSGVYTYWLAAIDSAGNYGTPGQNSTTVNQPPDYVLKSNFDSLFTGTKVNMAPHGDNDGSWITPVNTTETFGEHFTSRAWATPQDQINAGYPVFIQPNLSPGSYEETVDYGTVLASNRITITLSAVNIVGTVAKACTISVSPDGTTWTDYVGTWEVYATNFRYVKVHITFTASNSTDLLEVTGINIRLDSKLKTVTKMVNCLASDVGGTVVYLTDDWTATGNKLFIDVDAITPAPQGTTPVTPMWDFVDAPNPLDLKLFLFNNAGARVSGNCSLTVRGF